jgi:hypothetical protein
LITTDKHPTTKVHGEPLMQALMPHIGLSYTDGRNYNHGAGAYRDVCCLSPYLHYRQAWNTISWPQRLVPVLNAAIGASMDDLRYALAHRWRYARVANPLGQRFLRSATTTLYSGGDWCLDARVEEAWASGDALAHDILEVGDVG